MDENVNGKEQARLLLRVLREAKLGIDEVWLHYFSIGGEVGELEVDAYLHHAMSLPRLQRDILAQAANELVGYNPRLWAPYAADLVEADGYQRPEDEDGSSS